MENKIGIHKTMNTKRFTILHSNDMHGDFLAEVQGEKGELIGGLALLSGYINKVREEEEHELSSAGCSIVGQS
jgi:5'-nucleotidase/UDP-sugar diphosphatase